MNISGKKKTDFVEIFCNSTFFCREKTYVFFLCHRFFLHDVEIFIFCVLVFPDPLSCFRALVARVKTFFLAWTNIALKMWWETLSWPQEMRFWFGMKCDPCKKVFRYSLSLFCFIIPARKWKVLRVKKKTKVLLVMRCLCSCVFVVPYLDMRACKR